MDIKYILNCGLKVFTDKDYGFYTLAKYGVYNNMPDEEYVKRIYKAKTGKKLDLENPKTFNEKLQWLKLYDRKPQYTKMADKYEAKIYVSPIIGQEHIIPTLGVWDHFDDIDFDKLPDQFVLKCTHDSGGLAICKDKSKFNKKTAKRKIEKALKRKYFYLWREWPYKDGTPKIIAEELLEDASVNYLKDYKLFCFNGVVKCLYVTSNRGLPGGLKIDFFDLDWNHLPVQHYQYPNNEFEQMERPENLEEMVSIAQKVSAGIPFVRVDLYSINGKVYIGEMTFFPDAGIGELQPKEYNDIFGEWLRLPE